MLPSANADHLVDRRDEYLSVADLTGVCALNDGIHRLRDTLIRYENCDLCLGEKLDRVLRTPVQLRVALLAAEALNLGHRETLNPRARKALLHLVKLEWLDDRVDPLHRCSPLASGAAEAPMAPGRLP